MTVEIEMLSYTDQLTNADQVLVALILKNTTLGQALVDSTLIEFLAQDPANTVDMAHFFVNKGHLSRTEMYRLVKARNFAMIRKDDRRIARRAVRKGFITRTKVSEALDFQKQLFKALGDIKRLHEIFVDDGSMTKEQVADVLVEYRSFLTRRGEQLANTRTDPSLMRKQG